ncbi:response regulator transcription factor [Clostridium disporicum]|uniref:Heme response regulator HssR n=1 Tax=Clostridium disporicum TaxID=84024 RepID=A0A174CP63_9CLOT|nr:response regulator transcription factor [Clostridium disporicum]CUO15301.1 two component transcriptional regulator [Clostridium disporicum]
MFHILIVEDDKNTRKLMDAIISNDGYKTYTAENGREALEVFDKEHIDLVVLDIMMPEMDGYELTDTLRSCNNNIPILMVSAKQLPEDKKKGFLVGTDDYMTKPIDEEEMLLRIKALLRRSMIINERKLRVGNVVLDYDTLTVSRNDDIKILPKKEFQLLYKLLSYPNKIFTRLQLMDEIWGLESETCANTLNVHINRLRKKFEDYPEFELVAVRGLGYKAVKHEEK